MTKKPDLPYVNVFRDRHGKSRSYYRRKGRKVALPGEMGSVEWLAAYNHARAQDDKLVVASPATSTDITIAFAADAWFNSTTVKSLKPATLKDYKGCLRSWLESCGDVPISKVRRAHVKRWIENRSEKRSAANNLLKRVKQIFDFAVDEGWIEHNPAQGMRGYRITDGGFHSWTESEIQKFEARHPIGSIPRLAFSLLLYTAQRRSDVVKMAWSAIDNGMVEVRQQKTGAYLLLPLHPDLEAILAQTPRKASTILVTSFDRPYVAAGFGNAFRDWCNQAGLTNCSAHGLRKAAARRLAEAGATSREIMAVTGHTDISEVERYTKAADQKRLATAAMKRLEQNKDRT